MELYSDLFFQLWSGLIKPLVRLMVFIGIGLLAAIFIESLNWTKKIAAVSRPLVRIGHLSESVGAAFSMALVSGVAANTMLAESYHQGKIQKKELILANLFNSLPTYFLHLPTIIVITLPLIKSAALFYVGLTFTAALFRTTAIVLIGRFTLDRPESSVTIIAKAQPPESRSQTLSKTFIRFKKRMKKIAVFTIPIYIIIYILNRLNFFLYMEELLSGCLAYFPWLSPQALGIITLHMAAEITAGVAAAGALMQDGLMSNKEIVLALLVGNILSSPLRAVRHQFPYYAGIFTPKLAIELIFYNQTFRIASLVLAGSVYSILTTG